MASRNRLLVGCLFGVLRLLVGANGGVLYEWKNIDYLWDNSSHRQDAIDSGNYVTNSCIPYDVDHSRDGRTFVTVVRNQGVPATLTTVSDKMGDGGPLLKPYPSWSWNTVNGENCDGITSVYRVAIKCNYIFVLDNGKVGDDPVCPAKLLIFDLSTDILVKRVTIPNEYATNANGSGLLLTPIVETMNEDCSRYFDFNVYMADSEGYGLVVWNGIFFNRIEAPCFKPDPNAETFTVSGKSFHLADGVLGMSLADDWPNQDDHELHFRSFASYDMYYTTTRQLHSRGGLRRFIEYFKQPTKLKSQSAAQAFSKEGILFFSGMTETSILCWNRHKPFIPENIVTVLQNNETLQFASGIKTDDDGSLWVMTNHYQNYITNTMDYKVVNFRVFRSDTKSLIKGTNCELNPSDDNSPIIFPPYTL